MKIKTLLSLFLFFLFSVVSAWAVDVTVTSSTTKWTDGNTYNVTSNETINSRIIVTGAVTLNLGEGKTLTASKGIELSNGNKLTINGSGTLIAKGDPYNEYSVEYSASGIGAFHFGELVVNGGTINATGYSFAAGIGGSYKNTGSQGSEKGGSITINGGSVNANGGRVAAGIGGSYEGYGINLTINGGKVIARKGYNAKNAIGAGLDARSYGNWTFTVGWTNDDDFIDHDGLDNSTGIPPTFVSGKKFARDGETAEITASTFKIAGKYVPGANVTFNSDGGSSISKQSVAIGSTASEPTSPTRDGYNFRGWTLGGNPYDFSTAVNDDIELIAQWSAITALTLSGSTDNTGVLATAASGDQYNVTLSDRTIFADGSWNTLTLPFSLTASQIAASPLADLTIKEMNTATSGLNGEKLTLNFKDATTIEAGKPYIVKWQADREYDLLIRNKSDWDAFANRVNNGETFEGKVVMLANDFDNSASPVTKMVGYYSWNEVATSKPFKGVFDGNGRTLTVNISSNEEYTAPFRSVIGATVKNLTVAGNIQVSNKLVGGMIAFAAGNNLISKCRVSTTITSSVNGDGTVGGFVSNIQGGSTSIENSLFDGSFVGSNTTRWSGFVGWIESKATASHTGTAGSLSISYSLFSPASIDVQSNSGNSTFYRGRSGYTPSLTRYYYTKSFVNGNKQGTDASSKSASTLVSASYLGSNNWEVVSDNAVPKMTTTTTSHADIVNPTFSNVIIDAKASMVATIDDGKVSLIGTYSPFTSIDGLLFDEHNTANGAFYAALGAVGYTVGWFADEGKTTPVTSIPFASDGNATLYAELTVVTYSITYNGVEGATFETANPITYTVESADITLNNPSKDGYEFAGWTGTGLDAASTNVTIAKGGYGNREYTATWKKLLTNSDITIAAIPNQTYTGLAIEPEVTVTDGETPLTLGSDYTVSYSANTNAGTATVTITGNGDYSGTVEKTFEVTPKEITVSWGEQTSFVYNGTEQSPTATAGNLVSGDECTITVSGAKDVGSHTAKAVDLSNKNYKLPTENLEVQFEITPKEISVSWDQTSLVYNGKEQTPTATVQGLVNDDDCSITVSGAAKEVGTYTATVVCNDNYKLPTENLEVQFEITYTNLTNLKGDYIVQDGEVLEGELADNYMIWIADGATVTLDGVTIDGVDDVKYNWAGITCEGDCNIILAGTNVVEGFYEDYPGIYVPEGKTLTISGTGSLDASGNGYGAGIGGGYTSSCGNIVINGGTITATGGKFAAGIGAGYKASVGSIIISGDETKVTAIKGDDAPYSIGKGKDGSRTGKITIGGIENSDIATSPFFYPVKLLTHKDITVADIANQTYTGSAICPDIVVKDGEALLERDADYTVECTNNISVGTVNMTIVGKNYYEGSISKTFEITKATLTVTAKNKTIAYGDEPANDGVEYSSFLGSDDASVLGGTLTYGYNYEKGNKTGEYVITPSGLTADNYEINFVSGTLTVESKKLLASGAAQVLQDQNGVRAVLDGEYQTDKEAVNISTDTKVNAVEFKREFTVGAFSTIMLPFSIDANKVEGAKFYKITDIGVKINDNGVKKDTIWGPVTISVVEDEITANTPYLLKPTATKLSFDIGEKGVVLNTSKMNPYSFTKEGVKWELRGTYNYFKFIEDAPGLIGKSYGFAAKDQDNGLKVGEFRWTGNESFIVPMRCYLVYKRLEDGENGNGDGEGEGQGDGNGNGDGNGGAKPQMVKANAPSRSIHSSIPETLEVEIVDEKGNRTVIGTLNTRSGELRLNPRSKHTYDLMGRRMNASRKANKGVYVEK